MSHSSPHSASPGSMLRILRSRGLEGQLWLVPAMVIGGLLDGVSVVSLFPILSIITARDGERSRLQDAVGQVLDFLHLPLSLGILCLIIAGSIWLKAAINVVVDRQLGRLGAKVAQEMRLRLLNALTRAKWSYFTTHPVGRFVAAATSEANWSAFVVRSALRAVEQLIRTGIYCAIALFMGWRLAAVAIVMGVIMGLSLRSLTRAARRAGRARQSAMRALAVELNDVLAGFKPLKAMHRHTGLIRELLKSARRMRRAINALVINQTLSDGLPDLIQTYLLAAGVFLAADLVAAPGTSILMAGVVSIALMGSIARVRRAFSLTAQGEAAYWALSATIREVEAAEEATGNTGGTATPTLRKGCALRDVSFHYDRGPVLTHANLEIPAGRITTLIGPSGSGKTTVADLLLGLYRPDQGAVLVDGRDLGTVDIAEWREMIGYVAQEIILFNDTILANVALDDRDASEERVRAACRAAGLGEVLASLPDGLATRVGERGLKLSGGQRQRIALARAFLRKPKLLILDEATSALDPATEAEICDVIAGQPGLTILAITHQPTWVDRADRVYLVEHGVLREVDRGRAHAPRSVLEHPAE